MKIKLSITILLCLLSTSNFGVMAQNGHRPKTLYTMYGEPNSCADNFESLFKAYYEANITNAKDVKFIKYTALGPVKDSAQVRQYAEVMTSWGYPIQASTTEVKGTAIGDEPTIATKTNTLRFRTLRESMNECPREQRDKLIAMYDNRYRKEGYQRLCEEIKIGYEAFSIQFKLGDKPIEYFVFCDPATKEVVVDPNFKNITLVFKQAE